MVESVIPRRLKMFPDVRYKRIPRDIVLRVNGTFLFDTTGKVNVPEVSTEDKTMGMFKSYTEFASAYENNSLNSHLKTVNPKEEKLKWYYFFGHFGPTSKITGWSISYSTEDVPTATISISVSDTEFFNFVKFHKYPVPLMAEVEIFRTSFFPTPMQEGEVLANDYVVNINQYPYIRSFWGVVSEVNFSGGAGNRSMDITCISILRFLQIANVEFNPAKASTAYLTGLKKEVISLVEGNKEVTDIEFNSYLWFKTSGGLGPLNLIVKYFRVALARLALPTGVPLQGNFASSSAVDTATKDTLAASSEKARQDISNEYLEANNIMKDYWKARMSNLGSELRIYGLKFMKYDVVPNTTDPNTKQKIISSKGEKVAFSNVLPNASAVDFWSSISGNKGNPVIGLDQELLSYQTPMYSAAKSSDNNSSNTKSLYDAIKEVLDFIQFEFYQDTDGSIVIKPPYYNMITKDYQPHVVSCEDIITIDHQISEAEIMTAIEVKGDLFGGDVQDKVGQPYAYYVDYGLMPQFGYRLLSENMPWAKSPSVAMLYAINSLTKHNVMASTTTITIPDRPELRLGIPVYIKEFDMYGYPVSIQSSGSVGSSTSMVVTLKGIRTKFVRGIGKGTDTDSKLKVAICAGIINKEVVGTSEKAKKLQKFYGEINDKSKPITIKKGYLKDAGFENDYSTTNVHLQNNWVLFDAAKFNLDYVEYINEDQVVNDTLIKVVSPGKYYSTNSYFPLSDSWGYKVIGGFANGRGLAVDRDGFIVWNAESANSKDPSKKYFKFMDFSDLISTAVGQEAKYKDTELEDAYQKFTDSLSSNEVSSVLSRAYRLQDIKATEV